MGEVCIHFPLLFALGFGALEQVLCGVYLGQPQDFALQTTPRKLQNEKRQQLHDVECRRKRSLDRVFQNQRLDTLLSIECALLELQEIAAVRRSALRKHNERRMLRRLLYNILTFSYDLHYFLSGFVAAGSRNKNPIDHLCQRAHQRNLLKTYVERE